jgi:hypothetical protein
VCRRRFAAVLLLTITSAMLAGTPTSQASPIGHPVTRVTGHIVAVNPSQAIVCVGQKRTFTVTVKRRLETTTGRGDLIIGYVVVPGAKIAHDNAEGLVGQGTEHVIKGEYRLEFTAKKVGLTVLTFKTLLPPLDPGGEPITSEKQVVVEVMECGFKLHALLDWNGSGQDQFRNFRGHVFKVGLTPADDGTMKAVSTLEWVEQIAEPGVDKVWTMPTLLVTKASVEGRIDSEGVVVDITFDKLDHQTCAAGGGFSGCLPDTWTFQPIHVYFPAEDLATPRKVGPFTVFLTRDGG